MKKKSKAQPKVKKVGGKWLLYGQARKAAEALKKREKKIKDI